MSNKIFNKDKIKPIANEISKAMSNVNSNSFKSRQERIWEALKNPTRAVEVRGWLTKHKNDALLMKGSQGETMLHWAVLSEYSLVIDLISAGISPNVQDDVGRTPMDWLVERFWYTVVKKEIELPEEGILRIRAQTEELGSVLWSKGGRTSNSEESLNPGEAWIRGSAWGLLAILKDTDGIDALKNWGSQKVSAIHTWFLAEDTLEKERQLDKMLEWGLNIDEKDISGRTPLWYAMDTWIHFSEWEDISFKAIKLLLERKANPDEEDLEGISPSMLLGLSEKGLEKAIIFEELIKDIAQQD